MTRRIVFVEAHQRATRRVVCEEHDHGRRFAGAVGIRRHRHVFGAVARLQVVERRVLRERAGQHEARIRSGCGLRRVRAAVLAGGKPERDEDEQTTSHA
jgi:hypothetical protein